MAHWQGGRLGPHQHERRAGQRKECHVHHAHDRGQRGCHLLMHPARGCLAPAARAPARAQPANESGQSKTLAVWWQRQAHAALRDTYAVGHHPLLGCVGTGIAHLPLPLSVTDMLHFMHLYMSRAATLQRRQCAQVVPAQGRSALAVGDRHARQHAGQQRLGREAARRPEHAGRRAHHHRRARARLPRRMPPLACEQRCSQTTQYLTGNATMRPSHTFSDSRRQRSAPACKPA